jgi:hypothetical protein
MKKDKEKELDKKYGTPEKFYQTRREEEYAEEAGESTAERGDPRSPRPDKPIEYDKPPEDTQPGKHEW